MAQPPRLHVVRKAVEELSDAQIERLMDFGRREAALIDQIVAAERAGDRNLVGQRVRALVDIQDQRAFQMSSFKPMTKP
jgi:hypothetical protein